MSDPAAVDPEEALVAAASSCHMLSFLYIAKTAGFEVESYSDEAEGTVGKNDEGRIAITKIELRPEIRFAGREPTAEELDELHHKAHEACFIANSVKCEITVAAA
jgi:organic hydroperoxide reductase OsmC/OhrA